MSAHFRELHRLYAECLGVDDVDGAYSVDEAKAVKRIFANNAMLAASSSSSTSSNMTMSTVQPGSSVGFKSAHETDALKRVCNALLQWRREQKQQQRIDEAEAATAVRQASERGRGVKARGDEDENDDDEDDDENDDEGVAAAAAAAATTTASAAGTSAASQPLTYVDELRDESEVRLSWRFLVPFARDAAAVAIMTSTLARAVVDYHYATARPQQLDMFVHLSATEMFLVDGDALLMAALSSPHVDWDAMQPLHVLYNAQQLLRRLHARGARFHVVFFDDAAWVWSRAPQKRLVREMLRLTLTAAAAVTNATTTATTSAAAGGDGGAVVDAGATALCVFTFASFHCEAFARHVAAYAPEFMLVSDGEQLGTPTPLHRLFHNAPPRRRLAPRRTPHDDDDAAAAAADNDDNDNNEAKAAHATTTATADASYTIQRPYRSLVEDTTLGDDAAFYFRCMHVWLAARRVTVAYASRMLAKENAMIVFTVTTNSDRTARAMLVEERVTALAMALERTHGSRKDNDNNNSNNSNDNNDDDKTAMYAVPTLSPASLALAADEEVSLREQVVNAAVHAYLSRRNRDGSKRTRQQRQLCVALVATAYCTALLTAAERAQPAAVSTPALVSFLDEMACYFLPVLQHRGIAAARGEEADVYDGHVFAALVHHLRTTALAQLLDEDGEYDVNYTWNSIVRSLDAAASGDGSAQRQHEAAEKDNDDDDDDDDENVTQRPLEALPVVHFAPPPPSVAYQRIAHDLVDRLARAFAVREASSSSSSLHNNNNNNNNSSSSSGDAPLPYPDGFGDANKLRGWVVSTPFDALNDVVDSHVEAQKRHRMTAREQRQAERMEANYMQDAKEQAESMGLRGFTSEPLLCVRSDSDKDDDDDDDGDDNNHKKDNDDDDGGADADDEKDKNDARKGRDKKKSSSAAAAVRKVHAGQRNKKTRSKEEMIREDANLRDAYTRAHDMASSVAALLRETDHVTLTNVSAETRATHVATLSAALSKMTQTNLARKFESSEVAVEGAAGSRDNDNNDSDDGRAAAGDQSATTLPLRLAMWRVLVEASNMREAEFALTLDEPKSSSSTTTQTTGSGGKGAQTPQLYGVVLARQLVARCVGSSSGNARGATAASKNSGASSSSSSWGKLERLRTAMSGRVTSDEAVSYLIAVYLGYVQLHLQLRLMTRIGKLHLDTWRLERERARVASEQPHIAPAVTLFMYCHYHILAVVRDYGVAMAADDLDLVRSALAHFDFPGDYYDKLDRHLARWQGRALGALPPSARPQYQVCAHTPERMQLLHMGHLLERPVIAARDHRVVFNPDEWQRELLDIVDRRGSAVVCAPTSAGKTFISYYCMHNALRTSNRKIVVYIAPIRALINQAVVDVLARYGSKTYGGTGKNVCGVHGGDNYHRYLRNCQVLVTLPEVLEKMLLSPLYKEWAKNLDYAILDEIHTMESSGNGDVWERVLALLPCPFIALSATLGETRELCGWLNRVQARLQQQQQTTTSGDAAGLGSNNSSRGRRRRREYVVHEIPRPGRSIQRWNDIKKYIYMPPLGYNPPLKKLTTPYDARHIKDLHPLSVLTLAQLSRGFPHDITLVPSEVVQLYTRMADAFAAAVWPRWSHVAIVQAMHAQLEDLLPEQYFADVCYITQQHARAYETDVKNAFVYWAYLAQPTSSADGVDALDAAQAAQLRADVGAMARDILASFAAHLRDEEQVLGRAAARSARALLGDDGDDKNNNNNNNNNKDTTADDEADGDTATATVDKDNHNSNNTTTTATDDSSNSSSNAPAFFPDSQQFVQAHMMHVLRELKSRDMGPTIVFSFETEECHDAAEAVITALEHAEAAYRQTDEFARYVATMKRKAAAVVAARKQRESTLKQKRLTVDDDGNVERNERAVDDDDGGGGGGGAGGGGGVSGDEAAYEVPDVLPEFTFIAPNRLVEHATVAKALQACRKLNDKLAVRAIQRGIGIHHAGVKGKVRRQMEILFRGRHCGVVFATETLALGVHSPCRSVVLAGDHVLLNTTQFRQMMGRAGRRGLDYLGHLVFLGVSLRKITRLMTSGMTIIKGNVQCDALTQLRLLQLHDYAEHRSSSSSSADVVTTTATTAGGPSSPSTRGGGGGGGHVASAVAACRARAVAAAERLVVNPLFFAGRAAVEGNDLSALTVSLFRALLPTFQAAGLHFRDRPSSLGSLVIDALTVFADVRVGVEAFAFVSMLTRGVFRHARLHASIAHLDSGVYTVSSSTRGGPRNVLWRQPCNEAVAELLAYLFSRHRMCGVPLEVHRSVLSDPVVQALWRRGGSGSSAHADGSSSSNATTSSMAARQHRVVLAPLRLLCPTSSSAARAFDHTAVLLRLSAFYSAMAAQLREPAEELLPYMTPRVRGKARRIFAKPRAAVAAAAAATTATTTTDNNNNNDDNDGVLPLARRLRASAVAYRARHPLVAISGCGDYFVDTEDLTSTLRNGLYCDRQMLPLLDLTDGCRHDGAQVLINACVADFARCHAQFSSSRSSYRFTLLEELNGLSQSDSYAVLNHAERLLSVLAGLTRDKKYDHLQVLEALFPETDSLDAYAGAPRVLNFACCLKELRAQIDQHQQVTLRRIDNISERAGAVEGGRRNNAAAAAAASSDDDDDNDF